MTELHDTDADLKANSRGDARVDHAHMNDALAAARAALNVRNFPVGAILTIGGVHLARTSNQQQEHSDWASHAELTLLTRHSQELKRRHKESREEIVRYTTLEPCLMCPGAAVLHRVARIVFACPDPEGGAAAFKPEGLGRWYSKRWPRIERGPHRDEAYDLLVAYMAGRDKPSWSRKLRLFERMRATW